MNNALAVGGFAAEDGQMEERDTTFVQLVESERGSLLRLACGILGNHHEAEDMVQESVMRLFERRDHARNHRAFLFKTLSNLCIDRVRERSRKPPEPPDDHSFQDPLIAKESQNAIRVALDALDVHERSAVVLREVQQLSYAEIAVILNATVDQVTNWIHRGKMRLRALLVPYVNEGGKS